MVEELVGKLLGWVLFRASGSELFSFMNMLEGQHEEKYTLKVIMDIERRENMKKLLISEMVSVDGFFAGPNGEIDWHNVNEEFNTFAIEQLNSVDTLVFGRVTYELMASYWPTEAAIKDDHEVAAKMNALQKVVFSKTLQKVEWQNSRLAKNDIVEEITQLKKEDGRDMVIFGSGKIVSVLAQAGLIDEYRLIVNPVVLGKGKSLFTGAEQFKLKLLDTRQFQSGNVLLKYGPVL